MDSDLNDPPTRTVELVVGNPEQISKAEQQLIKDVVAEEAEAGGGSGTVARRFVAQPGAAEQYTMKVPVVGLIIGKGGEIKTLDFERIFFLIDLQPLFHLKNPNPYISTLLSSAQILLTFPPLSSSLFAFKFFFSSLSPLLSTSKLDSLLGKSADSFSFNHPTETLISLSAALNCLQSLSETPLFSPPSPRASLTADSLCQLMCDYPWEPPPIQDLTGTQQKNSNVYSNLLLLFSPVSRSLKCLSEFFDIEDQSLYTIDDKFIQIFGSVKERFVSRDINFSWIDVNYAIGGNDKDQAFRGLGFLHRGLKSLGWGFCSTDAIILGSALVPFGLIYPNIGCSLMGFNPDDCGKRVRGELRLEVSDVSGNPLECKYCELELISLKRFSHMLEPRNSSCDQGKTFCEDVGNRFTRICIREVRRNDEIVNMKKNLGELFLVHPFSREPRKDQNGDTSGVFFADRVLQMLQMETSDLVPGKPLWQLLLTFLYRQSYWATVTVSNGDRLSLTGILKPFTVNSAILCIFDSGFSSEQLVQRSNGFSSSLTRVIVKPDNEVAKVDSKINNMDRSVGSQNGAFTSRQSSVSQNGKMKRNRKSLKVLQDLSWSSFCEAALGHSEMDLEDIYFARDCDNSKKLKFLKCWMKQIKRSSWYWHTEPNEQNLHAGVKEESVKKLIGSEQESEQLMSSSFSTKEVSFAAVSDLNREDTPACPEASESFFSNLSEKIKHSLTSEDVDLGALAERLVSSSIYFLYSKHEMNKTIEKSAPEEQPQDDFDAIIAAELVKLLLMEPKDLASKYKGCNPSSVASDSISTVYTSEHKVREHELQILFRMEILQSKVGVSIEETAKQKMVKHICSLLDIIQCHLDGGFFGDASLDAYVKKTIKNRYSHSLGDVVHRIYKIMDLLLFEEDEKEAPLSLNNSEDCDGSQTEKVGENEIGGNARVNASAMAGKCSQQQQNYSETQHEIGKNDRKHILMEAQERRERARRVASFTSWIPDLQRVWAPKQLQLKTMKSKSEYHRKATKRRERRGAHYDVVCETPMSENKRSCTRVNAADEGETSNRKNVSVSKALFQDDSDSNPSSIS